MADTPHIRNPIEWALALINVTGVALVSAARAIHGSDQAAELAPVEIRRIGAADIKDALARGLDDFSANRTDVIFLCLIYPIIGVVLARAAFGYELLPLLFPLASGFALIGPVAAMGLYEMSRRREQGLESNWGDALGVARSPALGSIIVLALLLLAIFVMWLVAADAIYAATLGPAPPVSIASFVRDVFTTGAGWAMIVVGMGVGFLFAVLVLTISVVSFPLLLDRDVGVYRAVVTSVRAVAANPTAMALWGLIVAGGLVIGSLPAFIGLVIIMPVLGHATWHLYRKVVSH